MPLTSKDDVFRLDSHEKIQLLLNKKNLRETKQCFKDDLRMFYVVRTAVNANQEDAQKFVDAHEEALERIEIQEKLKRGFKGSGKLKQSAKQLKG